MASISDPVMPWLSDGVLVIYPLLMLIGCMVAIGYGINWMVRKAFSKKTAGK